MNARWFDRIIYGGAWKQIRFLIIIVVSLIVLSCLGVHWGSKYQMTPSEEMTVLATDSAANHSFQKTLWNVYNNFVDSGNLISISPEDRPWALIISLLGSVVLGGLLISTLSNIIERRVENCRNGLIHYKLSDHFVIIGADAMLPCLIRQLCQREKDCTLVIQTSKDVNEVRMELFSNLTKDEEKRIVLVHAMRDSKEELKKLYVADAKEVFILGDSGELDDVEELVGRRRALDLRDLEQLARDIAEGGHEQNHVVAEVFPQKQHDDDDHAIVGFQPVDLIRAEDLQELIDDAVIVEQHLPDEDDGRNGDHHGA